MQELIKISTNQQGNQVVSARDLHQFLEVRDNFTDWAKRMLDYGFTDGADFMGIEFNEVGDKCNHPLIKAPWPPVETLMYHSSWDWLMPVVEKIENYSTPDYWNFDKCTESDYCCSVTIESDMTIITAHYKQPDQTKQRKCSQFTGRGKTKVEAVYNAIVDFIKWHNTKTP